MLAKYYYNTNQLISDDGTEWIAAETDNAMALLQINYPDCLVTADCYDELEDCEIYEIIKISEMKGD